MICWIDCEHRTDEYCELFDDVVCFENCIFQKKEEK